VAKNRTELLHSIKGRLEKFISNPLLNPDFSDMSVGDENNATNYIQDIVDDVSFYIDVYQDSEHLGNLVQIHDDVESTMLDTILAMNEDVVIPDDNTLSEMYEASKEKEKS
tara:strand:- start:16544 stop:16876 length:333 start_codon:yes stop_codon:yes gene_type:complete